MQKNELPCQHGVRGDTVRDRILQDIRNGHFVPGDRLATAELAPRYGVSRTPVREALIRLEQDGLVTGTPNSGFVIRSLSLRELSEIYDIREALEGLAVERIVQQGDSPELIRELKAYCEQRRHQTEIGASGAGGDMAFHQAICRHCGSEALQNIMDNCLILTRIFAFAPYLPGAASPLADTEHDAIVSAMAAGNARLARKLLCKHIGNARKRIDRLWKRRNTSAAGPVAKGGREPEL